MGFVGFPISVLTIGGTIVSKAGKAAIGTRFYRTILATARLFGLSGVGTRVEECNTMSNTLEYYWRALF